MAHEPSLIMNWLGDTLRADQTILGTMTGVFRGHAPEGTALPYLIFDMQGGSDENAVRGRAFANVVMTIKVVSDEEADPTNVGIALDYLDTFFDGRYVDLPSQHTRLQFMAAGSIDYSEPAAGRRYYRHQGRLWRVVV